MKVVLDTNILLQSLGKTSRFRPIWNAYLEETFHLIVTPSIMLEYEEKVSEKTSGNVAFNVVSLIGEAVNSIFIKVYYEWNIIISDPDDNKFFDAAVAGNSDYLVTNDSHFKEATLIDFPKVNIISAETFLCFLQTS